MNRFDHLFFTKYAPEGERVREVYHRHLFVILDDVAVWLFFGALLPTLFYLHDSFGLADLVPLPYFEGFLAAVWAGLMWRVLDWYNDVWIITDKSVVDLDWTPLKQNVVTLSFENIEGIETKEKTLADNLLNRGDVIIHCIGTKFVLDEAWRPGKVVSGIREAVEAARHQDHGHDAPMARPQASEFEMLVEALKDIVRERMDAKRVAAMEQESFRPQLEGALSRPGTVDLRPDDQKWERYSWEPAPRAGHGEEHGGHDDGHANHGDDHSHEDHGGHGQEALPFPEEAMPHGHDDHGHADPHAGHDDHGHADPHGGHGKDGHH